MHITIHKSLRYRLFWITSESISWLLFFIVHLTSFRICQQMCSTHFLVDLWGFSRNIHFKQNLGTTVLWCYHINRSTDTLKCEEPTTSYPFTFLLLLFPPWCKHFCFAMDSSHFWLKSWTCEQNKLFFL